MTEAVVVETPVVETPAVVEANPVESSAREQGWVSKEEWVEAGRSADEWRPAKEFVDRGELYKSIHSTKRELKQTQQALTALQRHHQYVFDKAYTQAVADLRKEKRVAIREGDLDKLEEIETEIEQLQENHQKERQEIAQATQVTQGPPPELVAFMDRNPWYTSDETLRDEADAIGFIYLNKGKPKEGLLKHVEQEIKKKFPEKFGVRRGAPSPTAVGDKTARARPDSFQLDEMEEQIMKSLVESGTMTKAEYVAELKKAKGIK